MRLPRATKHREPGTDVLTWPRSVAKLSFAERTLVRKTSLLIPVRSELQMDVPAGKRMNQLNPFDGGDPYDRGCGG
jgi:hypothetical protein